MKRNLHILLIALIGLTATANLLADLQIVQEQSNTYIVTMDGQPLMSTSTAGQSSVRAFGSLSAATAMATDLYSADTNREVRIVIGSTWKLKGDPTTGDSGSKRNRKNNRFPLTNDPQEPQQPEQPQEPQQPEQPQEPQQPEQPQEPQQPQPQPQDPQPPQPPVVYPDAPQGLTQFDLSSYKVVEVKPSNVRAAGDMTSMIWRDDRDLAFGDKVKVSAVAYINYYAEKHFYGTPGFEKPLCVKLLPGEHKGSAAVNLGSKITGKPGILMAADASKPTVVDGIPNIGMTNWVVQGITSKIGVLLNPVTFAGTGLSEASYSGRIVRRFEGCTFVGGIQCHGGIAKLGGVQLYRCRLFRGGQGILAVHMNGYEGEPGLWLEECVIGDAGDSATRDHAMYITACDNVLIRRCIVVGASGSAAKVNESHNVSIVDSLIAKCFSAASPNSNTMSAGGEETANFAFTGNVVTDMALGQPLFWMGWSLNGAHISDNLFLNTVNPTGAGALFSFVGPFEGDEGAKPMKNVLIENNLQWNRSGSFLTIDTDFNLRPTGQAWSGIVLRDNVQGMPAGTYQSWQPNGAMAMYTTSNWDAARIQQALAGIEIDPMNIWAGQRSVAGTVPGLVTSVGVVDPSMNIAKLNKALGGSLNADQFYATTVKNVAPNVIIEQALTLYRAAYQIKP